MRSLLAALTSCFAAAQALPVLSPCAAAGRAGRWGLCADGAPVVLRGSDYIRLDGAHSTFDAPEHCNNASNCYNRSRYATAFKHMQSWGYNAVRVFLDTKAERGIGGAASSTTPLDAGYVGRLAQFIGDAEEHGIYTVVTFERVPINAYFNNITNGAPAWPGSGNNVNKFFLTKAWQDAWVAYSGQLSASLSTLLSPRAQAAVILSLQNEFMLQGDRYPFDQRSGTVLLADGVSYDMGNVTDRQQAADANTNLWASRARAAMRTHLPSTLVTVGVFTFQAVHKSGPNGLMPVAKADDRFPARPRILSRSGIDFLDVHIYQPDGSAAALAANLQTEEWDEIAKETPVVMGEFGCFKQWYPSAAACAPHIRDLQIASCARGFTGWLFWAFDDDTPTEQPKMYSLVDEDGAINGLLAPVANSDPCAR